MDKRFAHELAARLGDKARVEGEYVRAIVQHGDAWLATRIRISPVAEVFVTTRPLEGFTLSIKWGDRWLDSDVGDPTFDDAFAVETNDETLMRAWLDAEARAALLGSVYTFESTSMPLSDLLPTIASRTWSYELANDELLAVKGSVEQNIEKFLVAIRTACAVAARSQRWAAAYAEIARKLGGHAASEVVFGEPLMTVTRSAIDVTLRLVRRTAKVERLRTVVSAPRIGDGRLALWAEGAGKFDGKKFDSKIGGYQLRASDERAAAKIDDMAKKLVAATQPASVVIDADSVDVWFEGALDEHARIDTAIALAARLAVDTIAPQGPYR